MRPTHQTTERKQLSMHSVSAIAVICICYGKSVKNECLQTLIQNGTWSLLFSHSSSYASMKMYLYAHGLA